MRRCFHLEKLLTFSEVPWARYQSACTFTRQSFWKSHKNKSHVKKVANATVTENASASVSANVTKALFLEQVYQLCRGRAKNSARQCWYFHHQGALKLWNVNKKMWREKWFYRHSTWLKSSKISANQLFSSFF